MSDYAFSACYFYALCRDAAQTGNRYLNKSALICLTLLLVLITLPAVQLSAADPLYAGGSGTAEDPYLIETEAQFLDIAANPGAHFLLMNNITVTQRTGANLTGVFNGGGHTIHVSVNAGNVSNSGLFSSLSGSGTVRNVTFTGTYTTGAGDNSGLVAGSMSGSSRIEDVISRVNFTKSGSGSNTGGIVGSMSGGTIIRTVSTGNTVGNVQVGGITGFVTGGLIEQSLNTGNVHATGGNGSGGITGGSQAGTVRDSYSTGAVTGSINCGGAFGFISNTAVIERVYSAGAANCSVTSSGGFVGQRTGGTVSNVFYDLNRSILFTDPVAQGLSGARMRMASFFAGFNFDDVWQMHPDFPSYPLLRAVSYDEPFSSPAVLPIPGLLAEPMFASGTGTAEDPFVISSGAHVQNIGHNSPTHYLLANDVLVSQRTNIPFAGVLEGSGNTITLNFNLGNVNETGLFRLIRGNGTVRNLILDGSISQSGGSFTGSVAADMYNTSLIYRVISRVEINAGSTNVIGGLVGRLFEGTIRESAFMGSISAPSGGIIGGLAAQMNWAGSRIERSFNTGTLTAQSNGGTVGGIAASLSSGRVLDSFSTGRINAHVNCGGAFSNVTTSATVERVYAAGLVNCNGPFGNGGFVGFVSSATVSASFYDVDATGKTSSAGGTGLTGEEMRTRAPFETAGWVFEGENASWTILEAPLQSYPFLVWFDYDSQTDPPGYFSPFSGGKGTSADPYRIETEAHFLNISLAPAAHFLLMNNITVTERTGTALTGVFNGGGHTIHVSVNAGDVTDSGLFSSLSGSGTVRNVTFTGTYTTGVGDNSGLVAGNMSGSSLIEDVISRVNFTKNGSGNHIGGLVGRITGGTIRRSAVTGNISGSGFPGNLGGIAGYLRGGLIQQSFVSGTLSTSSNGVGGIVADVGDATIEDVYFSGILSAPGSINCSAGVGLTVSGAAIRRVYIAAPVNCGGGSLNGVIVGQFAGGSIINSYYDLNLAGAVDNKAGVGLSAARMRAESSFSGFSFAGSDPVWMMHPDFPSFPYLIFFDYDEPFQTPPVFPIPGLLSEPLFAGGDGTPAAPYLIETAAHFSNIGNLSPTHYLLLNDVTITQMTNLSFAGILEGGDNTITIGISQGDVSDAGLFRRLTGNAVVRNLTMTGTFTQTAGQIAGGLAAVMDGNSLIERVVSYVNVSAGGTLTVGAVVGEQRGGTIRYAASFGNTTASSGIGGLVGNQTGGLIEYAFNAGVVTATAGNTTGGIVGSTRNSTIRDSYSIGRINSVLNCGGAIGIVSSGTTVTRIYAAGLVNCNFSSNVGGLVGLNNGTVTDSFYDTQATGKSSSAGGTGLTTAQMRTRTPFENAGWVFEGENAPWNTLSVFQSYPFLRAFTYDNAFDPPETPVFPVPGLFNPFAGGNGSEASPFLISEEAHFMSIVGDAGLHYELTGNISVTQMTNVVFSGILDGAGHTIDVNIEAAPQQDRVGLFRSILTGTVRNVRFTGQLTATDPGFAGLVAAETVGLGRIENVYSSATVEVTGTLIGFATGGLTGRLNNAVITNSGVSGNTTGVQAVGGLAGYADVSSVIEHSFNTGRITASEDIAGGLAGRFRSTMRDSYSTGEIVSSGFCGGAIGLAEGFSYLIENIYAAGLISCGMTPFGPPSGGLIGWNTSSSPVVNSSYFDAEAAGIGWSPGGGEARTSAQMRSGATFAGWDFEDTWQIESGGVRLNYPYLRNLYWHEQQAIPGLVFHTDLEAPAGWQMLVSPAVNTTYGELLSGIWTQGYPGSNHPESNQPNVFWYNESQAGGQWQLPGDSGHLAGTGSASGSNAGRATVAWVFGPLEHNGPVVWPKPLLLSGTEQPGAVSIALSRTSETGENFAGWHLVGNPFADPLTWNAAAAAAQNGIEPVIYSWDKAAEAHRFVDGRTGAGTRGTAVNPFEGFWVRVAAGENSGTFNAAPAQGGMAGREAADAENDLNQLESKEEAGKLADLETEPIFIRLETAQQEHFEAVVLELLDFGDDVFYGSPAPLGVPVMQFAFAGAEGFPQASVGRAVITEGLTRSFPLVFDAALSGSFTLEVSGSDGWHDKIQAAVLDHHTGMVHPLSEGVSLSFIHQASAGILQLREQSRSMSPAERLALAQQPQLLTADTRFELQLTRSLPTNLEPENRLPSVITLHQNYPNPFNPTTTIRYALPEAAEVRLEVYNMLGQRVAVLVNGTQQAGWHTANFDASRLSSGLYLYRLQAGNFVEARSMMLVK